MQQPPRLMRVLLAWLGGIVGAIAGGVVTAAVCFAAYELSQLRSDVTRLGTQFQFWGDSMEGRLERIESQLAHDGHGRRAATRDAAGTDAAAVPIFSSCPRTDDANDQVARLRRGPG